MKPIFPILAATVALSGCLSAPQTTDEVRRMAGSNPFLKTTNFTVSRSVGAVNSSLSTGANKCLNRSVSATYSSPGPYGGSVSTMTTQYRTQMRRNASGGVEMSMHQKIVGGATILPQPKGGFGYVVDTAPAGRGTKVTIYGGKMGYQDLDNAVRQWAGGAVIRCPRSMPGGT